MIITTIRHHPAHGFVRITTDSGIEGMCPGVSATEAARINSLASVLLNQNPFERERLWQRMTDIAVKQPDTHGALAALDIALWDLAGKALGLPVYRVIGGFRAQLPAVLLGQPAADIEAVLAQAHAALAAGFGAFCDRFCGAPGAVAQMAAAVRAAVGETMYLMHDGQRRYGANDAVVIGRALQAQDYHWFKAPLGEGDVRGLAPLAAALDVPILDGANGPAALRLASQLAATQAADLIAVSVRRCGGITGALKVARLAEAFGLHCEFEPDDGCGGRAIAQLMGAVRNAQFYPVEQPDGGADTADAQGPLRVVDGRVAVPDQPGLGVSVTA